VIGFVNSRTGARTQTLSGYPTENEGESVARLKAAGWDMVPGSYEYDEQTKKFEYSASKETKEDKGEGEAEGDGSGASNESQQEAKSE